MEKFLILLTLLAAPVWAQVTPSTSPAEVSAPLPHLLEDNESYKVERFGFDGPSQLALKDKEDRILISLGEGMGLSSSKTADPEALSDGDVRFFEQGRRGTVLHLSEGKSQVLVIAIKHHWNADIRQCVEPKTCTHAIRAGGKEIGQSTSLFTNGFITAYRYRMDRGGTLSTSYYSSKGKHHLMFVALDELHASFDGTDQDLKRGQVFGTDAGEVEVDAGLHKIVWIVVRVELPKDTSQ